MLTAFAFIGTVLLLVALFRLALTVTIGFPKMAPADYAYYVWRDFVQHLVPALVILLSVEPVRRLGPRAGWHRGFTVALVVIVSAAAAALFRSYLLIWQGDPPQSVWPALHVAFLRFLVLAALMTMVAESQRREVLSLEAMLAAETERDMLEQQTLQARLKTLEAQIEPHFLFNTLATLRRLYDTDADAGRATFDRFIRYLELAPADRRRAGLRYAALVAAGKGVKLWDEALSQQIYLGDAEFIERMQALMEKDKGSAKDIPHAQRSAEAKPIDYYLKRNKDRDAGIREAVTKGQHSMTDVGKVLGLTVSRISRIVKAGNEGVARGKA